MSMGRSMANSGRPVAYMMIMILNSSNLIFDSDKAIQVQLTILQMNARFRREKTIPTLCVFIIIINNVSITINKILTFYCFHICTESEVNKPDSYLADFTAATAPVKYTWSEFLPRDNYALPSFNMQCTSSKYSYNFLLQVFSSTINTL